MGKELRGVRHMSPGASSTSSGKSGSHSNNFGYNQLHNNMLIASKRNNLRELAAEDLGLSKPSKNAPSVHSGHESDQFVMSSGARGHANAS
jgi:hypothetical protein